MYLLLELSLSTYNNLYFIQIHPFSSSSSETTPNQHSFAVNYFINSCGFPLEKALSASNYVELETPNKPDSVLAFLENHGFTKTQISNLVRKYPPVILCDPEKTLLPKFQFFKSKEETISAIKRNGELLLVDLQACALPNVEILREANVPDAKILLMLKFMPRAFNSTSDRFRKIVNEVKKMGFNPSKLNFVLAVHAFKSMSKSTWGKKVEVYRKWGLSEDDILVSFGKYPWCMIASEHKIMRVMDFLVNKMGWESSLVARSP
ncbi:uncharacterized protein LOC114257661 [Camellia sinensis]|uniref:uncharacterized protein LOC114257661 n=1 Tax=Camellia sinensis TaxID=4442 RepID=UPI001035AEC1|nr:uncharacterized protein LOC114257661 [Camellia sinensis]